MRPYDGGTIDPGRKSEPGSGGHKGRPVPHAPSPSAPRRGGLYIRPSRPAISAAGSVIPAVRQGRIYNAPLRRWNHRSPAEIGTRFGRPLRPPLRENRRRVCRGGLYARPDRMHPRRAHSPQRACGFGAANSLFHPAVIPLPLWRGNFSARMQIGSLSRVIIGHPKNFCPRGTKRQSIPSIIPEEHIENAKNFTKITKCYLCYAVKQKEVQL